QGFATFVGSADSGVQGSPGARPEIAVMIIQTVKRQQTGVRRFAHPSGGAIQKATLVRLFGVAKQLFVAGKIFPSTEIGSTWLDTALRVSLHKEFRHVPPLLGPAPQRVSHDSDLPRLDGVLDDGGTPRPDL